MAGKHGRTEKKSKAPVVIIIVIAVIAVIAAVFAVLMMIYLVALYDLQIIQGAEYYAQGENSMTSTEVVSAARGNVLDRYGRVLVSNSSCNNLTINVTELFEQEDPNGIILELCSAVLRFGDTYNDTLPITMSPPFEYTDMTELQRNMLDAWLKKFKPKWRKAA